MPITKISCDELLELREKLPVLDVRSPGEFQKAHIPSAFSFPIFSNEERHIIGTTYKQESREKAIKIGLDFFGKKMVPLVEEAERVCADKKKEVIVHCWRGGMRSAAIAWLLDLYGFKIFLLSGGYKGFRRWVVPQFEKDYNLMILGGCTGANKTGVLTELENNGELIIDLEKLAVHKGSAFGNLDLMPQPSQEHFENLLALELYKKTKSDKPVWLESESQRIGLINIPFSFHKKMVAAPLFYLDVPFEHRLALLVKQYGVYNKEKILNAIVRITKKLGGLETKTAVNALLEDDVASCFSILLKYYDKLYYRSLESGKKESRKIIEVPANNTDAKLNSNLILNYVSTN
ncbi:MAG: tRNA 2-selenouridine(34) synthase MnmH [Bacteroidia bacterium]|nr:tRNA 2-selenouridine(34) synthase MnmH [Bacteroidia bacterium]